MENRESEKHFIFITNDTLHKLFLSLRMHTHSMLSCEWWAFGSVVHVCVYFCLFFYCPGCAVIESAFNSVGVAWRSIVRGECASGCISVLESSIFGCMWNIDGMTWIIVAMEVFAIILTQWFFNVDSELYLRQHKFYAILEYNSKLPLYIIIYSSCW